MKYLLIVQRRKLNNPSQTSHLIYLNEIEGLSFLDLEKAAVCEQTGRIFPNAISCWGRIHISRLFESKIYPGKWVREGRLYKDEANQKELFWHRIPGRELEIFLVQKTASVRL